MQAVFVDIFVFMPVTRHSEGNHRKADLCNKEFIKFWSVRKIRAHKRIQEERKKKGREGNKRERVEGRRQIST